MSASAVAVVDTADKAIKAADQALDLYNKMVDQVIPWNEFKSTMEALEANQKQYSNQAAVIVGEVQTLLLNSNDAYDSSTQSVYRWCKMSAPVLTQKLSLFAIIGDPNIAEAQKILLMKVLDEGENAMRIAIANLEKSKSSFNTASGQLTTLKTVLDNDFAQGSSYYDAKISEVRIKAYAGAAAGAVFGPIGLAVAYAIAAGVVEGELIPAMEKAFAETKVMFEKLQDVIDEAQSGIAKAKVSLSEEIRVIGVMYAQIKTTGTFAETWALVPSVLFGDLKKAIAKLIAMCQQYIENTDKRMDEARDAVLGTN